MILIEESYVVTGDQEGVVALWDIQSKTNIFYEKEHDAQIMSLTYSPKHKIIVSASADESILFWDFPTGDIIKELNKHNNWVSHVQFGKLDMFLVSSSYDNTSILWNFKDKRYPVFARKLVGHSYFVVEAVFYNAGNNVISCSYDGSCKMWNCTDGECIGTLVHSIDSRINKMSLSSCERFVGTAGEDGDVIIWNINTRERVFTYSHVNAVRWIIFSSDSKKIVSVSEDKTTSIWSVAPFCDHIQLRGHTDQINCCIFWGDKLVTGSNDKTLRIWECLGPKQFSFQLISAHKGPVTLLQTTYNYLASISRDKSIVIFAR